MVNVPIIGLLGPSNSGKDTIAKWLEDREYYMSISLADPIKRFASCFEFGEKYLYGESSLRNQKFKITPNQWTKIFNKLPTSSKELVYNIPHSTISPHDLIIHLYKWLSSLHSEYKDTISPRIVLQSFGEYIKSITHIDIWSELLYKNIEERYKPFKGVVISDHRFKNEMKYTKSNGGLMVRIRRIEKEGKENPPGIAGHGSEKDYKDIPDSEFDKVLEIKEGQEYLESAYKELTEWINQKQQSHS